MFDFSHLFTFHGVDHTLYFLIILSFAILFSLQYLFCVKIKNKFLRNLPFLYVFFIIVLALFIALTGDSGGFIDLSVFFSMLLLIYAGICLLAIILAKVAFRLKGNFLLKLLAVTALFIGLFILGLLLTGINNSWFFLPSIIFLLLGIIMLTILKFKH